MERLQKIVELWLEVRWNHLYSSPSEKVVKELTDLAMIDMPFIGLKFGLPTYIVEDWIRNYFTKSKTGQ